MEVRIRISGAGAAIALQRFQLGLNERQELMQVIGAGQLQSVYKTFDEEGPGWVPLAQSTLKKKGYGAGHKLLVLRGNLRNSIGVLDATPNSVTLGTNLAYAAVHQFGSRDYGVNLEAVENPGQFLSLVHQHTFAGRRLGNGKMVITNAKGVKQTIARKAEGPAKGIVVGSHQRRQNIPPRPYLVFRPEDPERIATEVRTFVAQRAQQAGLET